MNSHLVYINLPGGIISTGDLFDVIDSAAKSGIDQMALGSRQQLLLQVEHAKLSRLETELIGSGLEYQIDEAGNPNIMSSYVCSEILPSTSWLGEGVYKDVLASLREPQSLKVNLTDPKQAFVPHFTGHLNFIASETNNFWYLYLRYPKTNCLFLWPSLVYSDDIKTITAQIAKLVPISLNVQPENCEREGNKLFATVQKSLKGNWQSFLSKPMFADFEMLDYEGFHSYSSKYWLGIYSRSACLELSFMKELCSMLQKFRINQVYTTPWKSLLIRGIPVSEKKLWDELLLEHHINTGHSMNELSWQITDADQESLDLKHYLVKKLDDSDTWSPFLSFALKTRSSSGLFGRVVVRKKTTGSRNSPHFILEYNVAQDSDLTRFQEIGVAPTIDEIATKLIQFVRLHGVPKSDTAALKNTINTERSFEEELKVKTITPGERIFECNHCMSRFYESLGEPDRQIQPPSNFDQLEGFDCYMCAAHKSEFHQIELNHAIDRE